MSIEKERILSSFGEIIRITRLKKHMSQRDLAQMMDLTQVHIGYLERGVREPSLTTAMLLCEKLELNINDVIKTIIEETKTPQP